MHTYWCHSLAVSPQIADFHDRIAEFNAFHYLRKHSLAGHDDRLAACALVREADACRNIALTRVEGTTRLAGRLLGRVTCETSAIAVAGAYRVLPALRMVGEGSISGTSRGLQILLTLKRPILDMLKNNEHSAKLLDRRFLNQLMVAYGSPLFLTYFLPAVLEAMAAKEGRALVAHESIIWLARRYGSVVTARFIAADLLRVLSSSYTHIDLQSVAEKEPSCSLQDPFTISLDGDEPCERAEQSLTELLKIYGVSLVTIQYLPFCADLVEQAMRRLSSSLESALLTVPRVVEIALKALNDQQLMEYLEEYIVRRVLTRLMELLFDERIPFSSSASRRLSTARALLTVISLAKRLGEENIRFYLREPLQRVLSSLFELYEVGEDLTVQSRKGAAKQQLEAFPTWFVSGIVERLAKEWGVPFLAAFCPSPSFLVPFVGASSLSSPVAFSANPSSSLGSSRAVSAPMPTFSLTSVHSGNRLYTIGSPPTSSSPFSRPPIVSSYRDSSMTLVTFSTSLPSSAPSTEIFEVGDPLSASWEGHVRAEVCAPTKRTKTIAQLVLSTFVGHSAAVKKIAFLSSENSFLSASADKTVRLWSQRWCEEETTAQLAYRNHSKALQDTVIMAENRIASTDGTLQVWDPYKSGSPLGSWEWGSTADGSSIQHLEVLDRSTLLAASINHATVKFFDVRSGSWCGEIRSNGAAGAAAPVTSTTATSGYVRALALSPSGHRLAVALSGGCVVLLDPRVGRLCSVAQELYSHPNSITWLDDSSFVVGDSDDPALLFRVDSNRLTLQKRVGDVGSVCGALAGDGVVGFVSAPHNTLRLFNTLGTLEVEVRLKSDFFSGHVTSLAHLPLNNVFLAGSSSGSIKMFS